MSGTYSGSDKRLAYLFENGGGGGSTTVVANPSGEATDDLEKLQVGETIYDIPTGGSSTLAGLGDVNLSSPTDGQVLKYDETNDEWVNGDGGGSSSNVLVDSAIDENNLLYNGQAISNFRQVTSYTATEDCYAFVIYNGSGGTNQFPVINDVPLLGFDALSGNRMNTIIPLKKGDVISSRYYDADESCYFKIAVYGRKPAGVVVAPIIYSQEEREVGVWTDGKPLYQKTIPITANIPYNNWSNTGVIIQNAEKVLAVPQARPQNNTAGNMNFLAYFGTGNELYVMNMRNVDYGNNFAFYITIQYTKSTDTAGSGSWTPSGAPAVHYSTEEQVVGTWIDGKTLYQKTVTPSIAEIQSHTYTDSDFANADVMLLMDGYYVLTDNYLKVPLNQFETGSYYTRTGFRADKSVYLYADGYTVTGNAVITVRYTKSS